VPRLLNGQWRRFLAPLGVALVSLLPPATVMWAGSPVAPVLASSSSNGYLLVEKYGGIFNFGDARFYGSAANVPLNSVLKGIAPRPAHDGYWTVAADGGVFAFGQAQFLGSVGGIPLNRPVWGMAATPTGAGYWLVATDGGIFSFGDAGFFGSTGGIALNRPIVGMAPTPTGMGYWLVASDGGIFSFGDAVFYGSTGSLTLRSPIVGMAATPSGTGYWLVAADGGVFSFGDAGYFGSAADLPLGGKIVGMAVTSSGKGYWLGSTNGAVYNFGDAAALGSVAGLQLSSPITGIAAAGLVNAAPSVIAARQNVVTASPSVTLSGSAIDSDGRVRTVEASVDGGAFGPSHVTCGACDTGAATWSFQDSLSDGTHHIGIRAIDDDGAVSTASSITVVVDTADAGLSIQSGPADGGSTAAAQPSFSGTAGDGGSGVDRVTVSVDGGAATNASCVSCGSAGSVSWSYAPGHALADGTHVFRFRAVDVAGNVSGATSRTVTIDTTAPAAPGIGAVPVVNSAGAHSVTLSGTAEANTTVNLSVSDAGPLHTVTGATQADGSGNWTVAGLDVSGLADGAVTVSATATDAAGNTGAVASASGNKDTVAPVAPLVAVFPAVTASQAGSVSFSGTAEANSTVSVEVSDAGRLHFVTASAVADGSGDWTVSGLNVTGLADGAITASATATDAAGNTGAAGARWGLKDTVAPATPTIDPIPTIDSSSAPALGISGSAEPNSTIHVSIGDGANPAVTATVVTDGSGAWVASGLNVSGLADGPLTVSVTATDEAGNTSPPATQSALKTV